MAAERTARELVPPHGDVEGGREGQGCGLAGAEEIWSRVGRGSGASRRDAAESAEAEPARREEKEAVRRTEGRRRKSS
nr:unnamed protein product [Digitaria exilis]